ncbi:D-alanyl-D-alanine carboxypeptidase (penicillin-binding protein 5/6) [Corynebacterium pollutisoli]|uniref:D-alanyl-D-alanine carboxypeptidase (Penicillin-binding protein 5/6) n=1 Tax=Corynebacterium pollutisoli TaxID=1610489 RepID=A0A1X7JAZ2_9CORY|nr:serine hydrolase [Corynebacterium pollutisoli]SMG24880.1 D-alanyl-D-alanine carboxypeptidase (penicillin-binding protein 5/6) [Corynebacterium pollutisoli]
MSFVMKMLASLTLAVALTLPPMPAPDAPETPESTEPEITTREHAPDTDNCPNVLTPPEPRTTSEVPQPGADPTPLPVVVDGPCGVTAPRGFDVPEEVHASAWLVADMDTGEVIAAKDPHGRYRPASIIKVLLAMVALEELDPAREVVIDRASAEQIGSAVGIGEGGTYTVDELLHGLMLASGNDAAHALAQELGGDEATLEKVNRLARELGTTDTRAASYSGLDAPGMSTSAFDMGLIYRAAYATPRLAEIMNTDHIPFPGFDDLPGFEVWNDNGLLMNDEHGLGGKTGFTDDANHTFVGAKEQDGRRVFTVILDTTTEKARPWEQARLLIDAALPVPAGEGVGLLEPVVVDEEEPAPTPAPEQDPAEVPGVHDADDPRPWEEPGIIAVVVVSLLALVAAVISVRTSGRPRRRPSGRGNR